MADRNAVEVQMEEGEELVDRCCRSGLSKVSPFLVECAGLNNIFSPATLSQVSGEDEPRVANAWLQLLSSAVTACILEVINCSERSIDFRLGRFLRYMAPR